ncbi:MAG: bifunctional (p)ppGpp synthetase/guanosine-3',5'-bis(diphosphate) 3'-pyrophosphohydrolase [Chlorobi bacterium]|nr:bifunctional (p)ppGpp synthetase/guanosine-3',5'-bis(diphosphate) 3'-pyrophosphohydrolase [Chlorobiota bacterium]
MNKKELTYEEKRKIVAEQFDDLIKSSPQLQKPESLKIIKKAFEKADSVHINQFRKTGLKLPYIVHPIAVAKIITTEMGLGKTTAAAALLHDTVEDSNGTYTVEDIRKEFGNDIAGIVDGVTKILEGFDPESTVQVETFKKFINSMSSDLRTAYVKIADRLHNLRTFEGISENSQMIKTAEAYDIYAPLAHLLGLYDIKKELEDLSFMYRMPFEYRRTKEKAEKYSEERIKYLTEISEKIKQDFPKNKFKYRIEITGRSLYRAWRITQTKKMPFKDIHNFNSVRIIITPMKSYSEKQQCYIAYSSLTDIFPARQHTFKDWITTPKSNGFQALIADIMYKGKWAEVQIMTEKMHLISTKGFASDCKNKHIDNVYRWVHSVKGILNNQDLTKKEILELIRPQHREIFALTPKGDVIKLPKDATVLDFAFQIHTDIGLHFQAAEVNGKIVSYNFKLKNADQVNIITSENAVPETAWIDALSSNRNKNLLRQYIRKQKKQKVEEGKKIYEKYKTEYKLNTTDFSKLKNKFHCDDDDELFYRLANGTIQEEDVAGIKIRRNVLGLFYNFLTSDKISSIKELAFNPKEKFIVKNLDNIELAKCCKPVAGDIAVVFRQNNNEFIIHRNECAQAKALNSTDGKNTAKVFWDLTEEIEFPAKIRFTGVDNTGLLADIIDVISKNHHINMTALQINVDKNTVSGTIELTVSSAEKLNSILKKIRKHKYIKKVYRIGPDSE